MAIRESNIGRILALGDLEKGQLERLKKLRDIGWEFISGGKAAKSLREIGIDYTKHSDDYIPELNGHPMLNFKILSGILADCESLQDMEKISDLDIEMIDIVLINFQKTANFAYSKDNPRVKDIDTCLFSYLIAAVQNSKYVNIITDPSDCSLVVREILAFGKTSLITRGMLVQKALDMLATNFKFIADVARYRSKTGQPIFAGPNETDFYTV